MMLLLSELTRLHPDAYKAWLLDAAERHPDASVNNCAVSLETKVLFANYEAGEMTAEAFLERARLSDGAFLVLPCTDVLRQQAAFLQS